MASLTRVFRRTLTTLTTVPSNPQLFLHRDLISLSRQPAALAVGRLRSGHTVDELSERTFEPNPAFLPLVHATLAAHVAQDRFWVSLAVPYPDNYMPIYDLRAPPVHGRIPDVEDIFGMVRVDGAGAIVPGSYERNTMYRPVSPAGLCQFSEDMLPLVRRACEAAK
ncbi:uncharacterized protein V1510DRAFT_419470 [Dipodascopsis tothii]|uniref:uncharacterized protein n=1 Tax=Dipodascopsis tothii TaxID=44089 RepID=UPI0034CFDA33